ncbi:hypothetical protein ABT075_45600 [Streptomyces sp. NPDC002677]|uniref:hypothetical protein n=1 Tax=Streptomyces sp. NPDC002677 TaxID=3154774 RepID=UPI00331ED36B
MSRAIASGGGAGPFRRLRPVRRLPADRRPWDPGAPGRTLAATPTALGPAVLAAGVTMRVFARDDIPATASRSSTGWNWCTAGHP